MDIEELVNSFEKNEKLKPYFYFYKILKEWAEHEWATILDESQVDHSILHSNRMISYFNEIHSNYENKDILSKYSPKYIIILVCSIYTHDIGMQNYYYYRLKDLKDKKIDNKGDLERIRQVHADTIDKVFTLLSENPHEVKFIDQQLLKVKNTNIEFYNVLLNLFREISVEMALVTQFHNKSHSLDEFNLSIEKLIHSKKFVISPEDKARLVCCAGMIQFLDAIDMSRDRVNSIMFTIISEHFSLPTVSDMSAYDIYKFEKYIHCYLIDKIEIAHSNNHIIISIKVSYSQSKYNNHKIVIDKIVERYRERLKRSGKDAISMVEILIKEKFVLDLENVNFDPLKLPVNDDLINFLSSAHENDFLKVLEKDMVSILPSYLPTYIKIYSQRLNIFFGGTCCYFPPDVEDYLSKIYFRSKDWNLDIQKNSIVIQDTVKFLLSANKHVVKSYKRYLRISKQFQSEIFIPIIYQNKFIGYLNTHYNIKKSKSILDKQAEIISNHIPILAQKIIFQHVKDSEKLLKLISSFDVLNSEEKIYLYDLFRSIFDEKIEVKTSYTDVNEFVNELFKTLDDNVFYIYDHIVWKNEIPEKMNRNIYTNMKFTLKFISAVIGEICDFQLDPDITIKCETNDIYVVIELFMSDTIGGNGQIVQDIKDYLNSKYLLPENAYQKKFDYPIIVKILLYPLGGKISMDYNDSGCSLKIFLPSFEK